MSDERGRLADAFPHHLGVQGDEQRRAAIAPADRCEWCEGTGNEFFAMYRRCPKCDGSGVKAVESSDG